MNYFKPMCKYTILVFTIISILHGGIGDSRLSLLAEARQSLFRPAPENFSQVYSDNQTMQILALGIGYKNTYLVARYRLFEDTGVSIITGVQLTGKARWREEIISLGLRTYEENPFYFELAYALGSVKESISTDQPEYTALNTTYNSLNNKGVSATIGINVQLLWGLNLTGEAEYIYMETATEQKNDKATNIGGAVFGIGISLVL